MVGPLTLLAEVDDSQVQRLLRQTLARATSPREALHHIGFVWERSLQRNFKEGGRPTRWKTRGDGKATHLGTALPRSVHHQVLSDGVSVGSNHQSARIHQLGGIVRPRRRQYLSIPLLPGRVYQAGAGAFFRRYPDRVFTVFKDGARGTVFMKSGPDDPHPQPIFLLRRKATIPARPWLLVHPEDIAAFEDILSQHLAGAFA